MPGHKKRPLTKHTNHSEEQPWFYSQDFFNPFPDNNFYTLPNRKSLQTTISNFMKMAESYLNG